MHQFGWLSDTGGNFLNLLQKEGIPRNGGGEFPQKRGGCNPGGNYGVGIYGAQGHGKIILN